MTSIAAILNLSTLNWLNDIFCARLSIKDHLILWQLIFMENLKETH